LLEADHVDGVEIKGKFVICPLVSGLEFHRLTSDQPLKVTFHLERESGLTMTDLPDAFQLSTETHFPIL
jgi:hypothetical protein